MTVLGAYADEIALDTNFSGTEYILNPNWDKGLGNSISCGAQHLLEQDYEYDGILVMLCDQPLIDALYLNSIIDNFSNSTYTIVATQYDNRVGVPAIFGRIHFEALLKLNSDFGAREIIKSNLNQVLGISADGKELDIDTKEEYERVKKSEQ